ncbi:restriction endonuclease subunit S, partial [Mariniphaga sediminis]|uniref:restriction endonuclease subunit S n=1 Tax=Mariniphaga sediminis TaxID=1628158 RepID=UPI003567A398
MDTKPIGKLVKIDNGFAFKSSEYSESGARIIRIANVQKGEIVDSNPKFYPNLKQLGLESYKIYENDLLMSLTGNVGRVGKFPRSLLPAYLNQRVCRIRIISDRVVLQYLFHFFNSDKFEKEAIKASKGIAQLNLSTKWIEQYKIPLPPIAEQKRIATILDKADALRQRNKQLLAAYDELLQSVFLELFGNPVRNEQNWPVKLLSDVSEVVSGVTKGRKLKKEDVISLPYIRVANVQDGHLDLNEIKTIDALPKDLEKYRLFAGDILLTEGGDADKLGRGAVWKGQIDDCIHQNHIFRLRIKKNESLTEDYLSALIGSGYGKRYFLKASKQTTGIASINSTQLKKFPV